MKKKIRLNLPFFLIISVFLTSCVSKKQIVYFQKGAGERDTIKVAQAYTPKIQSGDILSITVGSLNSAASSFFNPFSSSVAGNDANSSVTQGVANNPGLLGFLVDSAGMLELPLIGQVKVANLTTSAARDTIKNRLKFYLKEPTVNVRFLNYKISIMGEVVKPSVYVIPNERITLPEALSMAGDLTIYGERENILVIRDNNGKKEFGRVNLTTRSVYNSPYYYLHANDIVYVEPAKGRISQSDKIYQLLPVALSALSLFVVIFEYARR